MNNMKNLTKKISYPLLLLCAVSLLFIMGILFLNKYNHLKNNGKFHTRKNQPVLIDINKIQNWMTFDYINHSFSLPQEYLKNELNITDSKYPRITITKESTNKKENMGIFTVKVKDLIKKYLDSVNNKK